MVTQITIYWDLDTCRSHRIESVAQTIRRLCVLPNNLKEKDFICLTTNPILLNANPGIRVQLCDKQLKYLFISFDIRLNLFDDKTSLLLITSDRHLIEAVIKLELPSPICLILGNNVDIGGIQLPPNINVMGPFGKFETFCHEYDSVLNYFCHSFGQSSGVTSSDQIESNSVETQTEVCTHFKMILLKLIV